MKQILFLFFTFSGICTGFAQKTAETGDSIHVMQNKIANTQPIKNTAAGIKDNPAVRLFPNPAKNSVEIEIKGFEPGYVLVQLIDKHGNIVRNNKRLVFYGNEIIVFMFSEKPGLYFLLLKQGEKKVKRSILIQ